MKNGGSDNKRRQMADLEAIARSLQSDPGTTINIPVVVTSGVIVAFIVLPFTYAWPLWISPGLIVLLGAAMVVPYTRRSSVTPLELTQGEREHVRCVLSEHGIHSTVTLVRALYSGESPATVVRTVKLPSDRMLVEQGNQGRRG